MTLVLHQSDIQSWARCPQAWHLERQGAPRRQLSATAFGTVVHHALHAGAMEGNDVQVAIDTFDWYWHPLHIGALTEPVDTWLPGDSHASLQDRGRDTIRKFFDLARFDEAELLALEFEFAVPMDGVADPLDGSTVVLAGTVDRLVARRAKGHPEVGLDDLKTGRKKTHLRHNPQGTAYCYASTLPQFWQGNPAMHTEGFGDDGTALYLRFASHARRFTWIDLKGGATWSDGGYRGPGDYARLKYAAQQLANSIRAGIFPLTMQGDVCTFCDVRASCAGIGLDDKDGDPRGR
jgi:hypothetical protein